MSTSSIITYAIIAIVLLILLSKLFWIGVMCSIGWFAWWLFKNSDTYKKYQ